MLNFVSFLLKGAKDTVRNRIILPAGALMAGAAGFVLRALQWKTDYDALEERFLSHGPITPALVIIFAVFTFTFLMTTLKFAPKQVSFPLVCRDPLYMMLMASGGFLFFGAGALGLLEGMEQLKLWGSGLVIVPASYPMALLLCGGLCFVTGLCVLVMGKNGYRPAEGKSASLPAVIPPFTLLVWLFATHQGHATDPIFMGYGVHLSAAVLLTLAHYDAAGFYHGQRHTRRFLFCTLTGTFLALASFADGLSLFQMAMAAACTLSALGQCYALLSPATEPEH